MKRKGEEVLTQTSGGIVPGRCETNVIYPNRESTSSTLNRYIDCSYNMALFAAGDELYASIPADASGKC